MGALYIQHEYWFSVFQLVTARIGKGATLTPKDFRELLLEPKAVSSGTAIQIIIVPLIAFVFIEAFGLAGGMAVGFALIASVPGGSTSNIFTHFARGNIALSVAITAITTLACLFTTPLILGLLIENYMPADFVMPRAHIMKEIGLTLLLPLGLGMLYLKVFPATASLFSKWAIRASMFGLFLIVVGASASGRLDLEVFGYGNVALIVGFIIAMGLISWIISWGVLRLPRADATAVDMEVIVRNVNLGLMLKALLFPAVLGRADPLGDTVLLALLLYGGLQMLVAAVLIAIRRLGAKKLSVSTG